VQQTTDEADDTFLTPDDLAARYGVKRRTVLTWNWRRIGPPYSNIGGVIRYRKSDVDAWEARRIKNRDTA
jgi:predicted DNA-binding transcriptional regulator AlpA